MHAQTQQFLDRNDILYKFQSAFRVNHSIETSLSYINNKIMNGFDNKSYTGMILIDLQKAFDTIDHEIFLNKIKCLGFSDSSISWYKSYLENRYFKININNSYSEQEQLLCGVPQGSILGPLMFLIYINDMAQSVDCDLYLFADDACIVYTSTDINAIENKLNKNFNSLCDWLVENKLSIHFGEDKTKSILFGAKRKLKKEDQLHILRGDIKIKQHKSVSYLGCIMDCNLSGEEMATAVLKKINSKLKFLYRKQNFLSKGLRRLLCNALIQPHFDYACQAWFPNLNKSLSMKIQSAQNKCIRYCLNLNNQKHLTKKDFQVINWLPTSERVNQRICVNAYKSFNNMCPSYMSDIFVPLNAVRITRYSVHNFKVPFKRTDTGQNALSYVGPKLWNKLPIEMKILQNTNAFKHKIKEAFLNSS